MAMQLRSNCSKLLFILLTINIFLTKIFLCDVVNTGMVDPEKNKKFGMPTKDDLNIYLDSLEKIVYFGIQHKQHVDMNFKFGLFLMNVHLKPFLNSKSNNTSAQTYNRLGNLLHDNDRLIKFFHFMVDHMPYQLKKFHRIDVNITSLFSNETLWSNRMPALTHDLEKTLRRTWHELRSIYSKPNTYQRKVSNSNKGNPSPKLSKSCMSHLAENPVYDGLQFPTCQLPENCTKMLKESTALGYFITRRLLYFIGAHLGRGCVVYSQEKDASIMREICTKMFDEANYIAMNKYKIKDLLFEEVSLCALSGHARFLQRRWIWDILHFQTKLGCFGNVIPSSRYPKSPQDVKNWSLSKVRHQILGGYCNTHLTAVVAASLAAAIRYILENN